MKNSFQTHNEGGTVLVRDAVKYGRVSSKEQEKEGFSIPAQWKLLDQHAKSEQFRIVREFVDVRQLKNPVEQASMKWSISSSGHRLFVSF